MVERDPGRQRPQPRRPARAVADVAGEVHPRSQEDPHRAALGDLHEPVDERVRAEDPDRVESFDPGREHALRLAPGTNDAAQIGEPFVVGKRGEAQAGSGEHVRSAAGARREPSEDDELRDLLCEPGQKADEGDVARDDRAVLPVTVSGEDAEPHGIDPAARRRNAP